jgi:hypothetical protein
MCTVFQPRRGGATPRTDSWRGVRSSYECITQWALATREAACPLCKVPLSVMVHDDGREQLVVLGTRTLADTAGERVPHNLDPTRLFGPVRVARGHVPWVLRTAIRSAPATGPLPCRCHDRGELVGCGCGLGWCMSVLGLLPAHCAFGLCPRCALDAAVFRTLSPHVRVVLLGLGAAEAADLGCLDHTYFVAEIRRLQSRAQASASPLLRAN